MIIPLKSPHAVLPAGLLWTGGLLASAGAVLIAVAAGFSPDEGLVFVASVVVALLWWLGWYRAVLLVGPLFSPLTTRRNVLFALPACLAAIYVVLQLGASPDVQDSFAYLLFYVILGAATLALCAALGAWLGISVPRDLAERDIQAVIPAWYGALLGAALCYAGGNVGSGPGWWVVVFSAGLALVAWFAGWFALALIAGIGAHVVVDRNLAAGWRLAGVLTAGGIILGRAVAGDWVSASGTVADFARYGWPWLVILVLAALVERRCRPTPERPAPTPLAFGIAPGLLFVVVAFASVWLVSR